MASYLDYYIQSPCPAAGSSGFTTCTMRVNVPVYNYNPNACRGTAPPATEPATTQLYPNPTSGIVEIKADKDIHYQWIKVTDARGTLRYQQHSKTREGIQTVDLKALVPGIYQVQLYDGKQLATQHLIKE